MNRTFNGALHADTLLYQLIVALGVRSGSVNSVNAEVSRLLGRPIDIRKLSSKSLPSLGEVIEEVKSKKR